MFLSRLKLKYKIILLPTISILGFLVFLLYSINSNINNEKKFTEIGKQDYPILNIVNKNWILILEIEAIFNDVIADQDEDLLAEAKTHAELINSQLDKIIDINTSYIDQVRLIKSTFKQYFSTALELAAQLSAGGSVTEDNQMQQVNKMHEQYTEFKNLQRNLKMSIENSFAQKLENAAANTSNTNQLGIIVGLILTILLITISTIVTLLIIRPLKSVNTIATDIMNGKWDSNDQELQIQSNDEISQLIHAFLLMKTKLRVTITNLEKSRDIAIAEGKANKEKSIFISNISHELRTPIHALLAYGKLGISKNEKISKEKSLEYFEKITTSASRLSKLVNDILCLSNLQSEITVLKNQEINLKTILETVIDDQQTKANNKLNVKLETDDSRVNVDPDLIKQVLINCITNAQKYAAQGSLIEITLFEKSSDKNNNQICVSIKDEGIGIPENELSSIFEPFTQSSRTTTGAGGAGLGLSICKAIIELHKGEIWVDQNTDGNGVTFTFCLTALVDAKPID